MVDRRHDRPDLNNNNTTANAASGFEIFVDDSQDNDGGYNLDQSHVQNNNKTMIIMTILIIDSACWNERRNVARKIRPSPNRGIIEEDC